MTMDGLSVIEENFAGMVGTDSNDFIAVFTNFITNSFHVLIAALFDVLDTSQITVEYWIVGGKSYTAYIGNFGARASAGVQARVPPELFGAIESAIKGEALRGEIHWVRTFFANLNGQRTLEALIDNKPWQRGRSVPEAVPWVGCDGYYSVRNFIMLLAGLSPDAAVAPNVTAQGISRLGWVRRLLRRVFG